MHNFQANYEKILEVLHQIESKFNFLFQIRKPKLRDKKLIAINLTSEYMSIDSEHQLFRVLPKMLISKIERSVYNRINRKLFPFIEQIRQGLSNRFNEFEDYFIVDCMLLEVCKLSRSSRSKICKEHSTTNPDKGYLSSKYQLNLFETSNIKLNVPMRKNQYNYKKQPYVFRKSRKRIETLF